MIPPFNDDGYLPAGIHVATMGEVAARFGQESELRRAQMQSLGWLIDAARRAGVQRLILDGSFVTEKLEPNDVDCALLLGPGFPRDAEAEAELQEGLPFLNMHAVEEEAFAWLVDSFFATDRQGIPKGMIEVVL